MRQILLSALLLMAIGLNAQNLFPEKFSDCEAPAFFLEGKEIYTQNLNEDIIADIIHSIDPKKLGKIRGKILLQVYIDTLGNNCCISIKNELNGKGKKIDFKKIIESQTKWTPPIREGKNTAVSIIIRLRFDKEKIVYQRLGYNRKLGLLQLKREEFRKE